MAPEPLGRPRRRSRGAADRPTSESGISDSSQACHSARNAIWRRRYHRGVSVGPGLRARKKRETRRQVRRAANEAFLDRGYQQVTIDEIAEALDLSPRTIYRYFPYKEDLVLGNREEVLGRIRAALAARPRGEHVLDSIRAVALAMATQYEGDPASHARIRIIASEPALQRRQRERQLFIEAEFIPFVAERLGLDPDTDLLPRLLAASTTGAIRAALATWTNQPTSQSLTAVLDEALEALESGLGPMLRS